MTVRDKVVAITGASGGIGRATALLLASQGARVVLGARRETALRELSDAITDAGGAAAFVRTDVSRRADVEEMVRFACHTFGRLDVLVGNAGIAPIARFDALRVDDWERMVDINVKGVLYGVAATLPIFRRQGSGHFVNVISTAGLQIAPMQGVYAGTKNAIRTITEALRQEAGPDLRVTAISPGLVRTDLADSMSDPDVKAMVARRMASIGLEPEAVARCIAFAIEQADHIEVGELVIRPTAQG